MKDVANNFLLNCRLLFDTCGEGPFVLNRRFLRHGLELSIKIGDIIKAALYTHLIHIQGMLLQ